MTILVGTTLCRFAMGRPELWSSWMANAQAMRESTDEPVEFFAAIELDALGRAPFADLIAVLEELALPGQEPFFMFTLDDGRTEVTTSNRLRHITMGQNLVTDYACSRPDVTHLLFMAADCMPAADAIPKLIELDWPLVGGHIPTYCLDGPLIPFGPHRPEGADVREHMASAAFIMLRRDLFTRLRWRWSLEEGMSDDPCLHTDAIRLLGIPTYVRHDVLGRHYPEVIPAIEQRGYDLTVTRAATL